MTLIIAIGNQDNAIIASDRRLVIGNRISDEESIKSILLTCDNGRIGMAYTGLAKVGKFSTHNWILENLTEICKLHSEIEPILEELTKKLTSKFNNFSFTNPNNARLSILGIGYEFHGKSTKLKCWRITNFEYGESLSIKDKFKIVDSNTSTDGFIVEKAGFSRGVLEKDIDTLKQMLSTNAPTVGLENKLYDSILNASNNRKSLNMIGPQANTIVISKIRNATMRATYFSDKNSHVIYGASSVLSARNSPMTTFGSELIINQNDTPAMIKKVSDNELCPCESGVKYKYCHKKFEYPFLAMTSYMKFDEKTHGYIDSGNVILIQSRGAVV